MIHRIQTSAVPDLWPLVHEHAIAAMKWHPFMDENDLLQVILAGQGQLFIVTKNKDFLGFAACEVIQYPSRRVANVLAAGGRLGFLGVSVKELFPALEGWAREHDADIFAVQGRPGWLRIADRISGTRCMRVGVAWRPLAYERRRRIGTDNSGIGALEGGATVSGTKLQ